MSIEITMPRLSDTMESGTVLKWNVAEGDAVASGDVVADVETDKATMELTVFDEGTMARILVREGQAVDVGTPIAILAEEGEDRAAVAASAGAAGEGSRGDGSAAPRRPARDRAGAGDEGGGDGAAVLAAERGRETVEAAKGEAGAPGRLRISPVARRLADEHEIDVQQLTGTGPAGRIIKRDVLRAVEAADETAASVPPSAAVREPDRAPRPAMPAPVTPVQARDREIVATAAPDFPGGAGLPALEERRVPLSGMRQTIARRLVESATTIPHYQVSMTFDMDALMELRERLNEQLEPSGVKLSVNDFLVRGCALAMYQHPEFNASWDVDAIRIHGEINVGIAIAVGPERGGGLVVGVIREADRKSLRAISGESRFLARKARERGLSMEEMTGATFTISNLGMYGVEHFTAIINPPNSAILAVGAAIRKPVVRDGELAVGYEMAATLSNDHRVIDGAMAAQFLGTLRHSMEHPATLLV